MEDSKELVQIIQESGLEKTQGDVILANFTSFVKEFNELEAKAKGIVIKDPSQVEDMATAREVRLALKTIRVNTENTRKTLKDKSLREGKAIDGIANIVKALIVPVEEYLESQEKYVENIEKERKAKIEAERTLEMSKYTEDLLLYNYKDLNDEAFANLISVLKKAFDDKQEIIRKAELQRVEDEKKEKAEQERIRVENEKLKKENAEKDKIREKEKEEENKKLEAEKAKLKKEIEERERLEKKIKDEEARKVQDKKDKELADLKQKQEEAEKVRQASLAPEKDKLFDWSEKIKTIEIPSGLSVAGLQIVKEAEEKLLAISQEIKIKIKNL